MNKSAISQHPKWPNKKHYNNVIQALREYPNLVFPNEIIALKKELLEVSLGNKFIIQGGDCAETFNNFNDEMIKNKLKILLQMSAIIQFTTKIRVTNIGRIAGQYIKPRTNLYETRDKITLPSYRGDGVNSIDFNKEKRIPNPDNLTRAYHQSSATMNLIRTLIMSGFTDIENIQLWHRDILDKTRLGNKYNMIVEKIKNAFEFIETSSDFNNYKTFHQYNFYTSHEALLIDYEKSFLQQYHSKQYCCSGHMLWLGDRTRHKDSKQVKFLSSINNPIGIKVGPKTDLQDLNIICTKLNPLNEKGKIILILRLGEKHIKKVLPKIIKSTYNHKHEVLWFCDPMHGNTIKLKNGFKTRRFATIIRELKHFFSIITEHHLVPGGVHFELTGEKVTECLGGIGNITDKDLNQRYETTCDPRLNNEQSLEIAFLISELIKGKEIKNV